MDALGALAAGTRPHDTTSGYMFIAVKATPNNTRIKSDRDRVWRVMGDSGTVG
jgi:hypothetical protein